jgi:hypothetical protein
MDRLSLRLCAAPRRETAQPMLTPCPAAAADATSATGASNTILQLFDRFRFDRFRTRMVPMVSLACGQLSEKTQRLWNARRHPAASFSAGDPGARSTPSRSWHFMLQRYAAKRLLCSQLQLPAFVASLIAVSMMRIAKGIALQNALMSRSAGIRVCIG